MKLQSKSNFNWKIFLPSALLGLLVAYIVAVVFFRITTRTFPMQLLLLFTLGGGFGLIFYILFGELAKRVNFDIIENNNLVLFGIIYLALNYTVFIKQGVPGVVSYQNNSLLDSSWVIALNWASYLDLNWLKDNLVFTFGPLYYLGGFLLPEFHSFYKAILIQIGLNLFYTVCFAYVYSFFVTTRKKTHWASILVLIILLTTKPDISLISIFVAFFFLPTIFSPTKREAVVNPYGRYFRYSISTLLLAVNPFIKFSHIYESLLLIIVMIAFLIYDKRYFDAMINAILYSLFTATTWVFATGQNLLSFLPYLGTRLNVSSGYTEAMALDFTEAIYFQIFILALLYIASLSLVLIFFLLTNRIKWAIAWTLPMISLFLGFKSSFVRADAHAYQFLGYVPLSVLYYYYIVELMGTDEKQALKESWRKPLAQLFVPLLLVIAIGAYSITGIKLFKNELLSSKLFFSRETSRKAYSQNNDQDYLQKIYAIDTKFINHIDPQKSIDIIPWDIALLFSYELNWTPRPVMQSYASYTSTLDNLDASFFQTADSPDQIIYSLDSIDNRYAIFDTPHTFRILLEKYQFVTSTQDNRYALLEKKSETFPYDTMLITQNDYGFDDIIQIPKVSDGYVIANVEIEPTVLGNLFVVLYKPTPLGVEIELTDGTRITHRFIRDTGKNGLFVSSYVKNLDDLQSIYNGTYESNIKSFRFIGSDWIYANRFKVVFFKVQFNN